MWRVLTGRHVSITLSFLLVGHTKFSPDWGFGLLKQKFRRELVSSLDDLVAVINSSSAHNTAQLAGREDGSEAIPIYDWAGYLKPHFCKIVLIKSYQHFTVTSNQKGYVMMKHSADGEVTKFNMLKDNRAPHQNELPAVVPPPGLSLKRQWYLFDSIRQFCTPTTKDIVCPQPASARPTENEEITPPASPSRRSESPESPDSLLSLFQSTNCQASENLQYVWTKRANARQHKD